MEQIARISGFPLIERKSIFHALNQKAVARRVANELGKKYEDLKSYYYPYGWWDYRWCS